MTIYRGYIKMTYFFKTPKIGTIVISKLWTFISYSKQTSLEHARGIFYNPQKFPSNGVLHASIGDHLILSLKGFLVGSQIFNLIINFSFDHNSCILHLNEQCEGTLGIYISRSFQCYPRVPIWYLFAFSTKALDI